MKDTVGGNSDIAILSACVSAVASDDAYAERLLASAYGCAFRAAELAYDLGVAHGRTKPMPQKADLVPRKPAIVDGVVTYIPEGATLFVDGEVAEVGSAVSAGQLLVVRFTSEAPASIVVSRE